MKENIYSTQEKLNVFLNIEEADKLKFEGLYIWCVRAMELTVKERFSKLAPFRGDIWTCDFGVNVGSEIDKVRPCIIITPDEYNRKSNIVSVIPITHAEKLFDTQVELNEKNLAFKENSLDGIAKLEQIRPASKARLGRCIGRLSAEGMKAVENALLYHCGVGTPYVVEDGFSSPEDTNEKNS